MVVLGIEILHNPTASMQYRAFVTYKSRSDGWFGSKSVRHVEGHTLEDVRKRAKELADHLSRDEWTCVEEVI